MSELVAIGFLMIAFFAAALDVEIEARRRARLRRTVDTPTTANLPRRHRRAPRPPEHAPAAR